MKQYVRHPWAGKPTVIWSSVASEAWPCTWAISSGVTSVWSSFIASSYRVGSFIAYLAIVPTGTRLHFVFCVREGRRNYCFVSSLKQVLRCFHLPVQNLEEIGTSSKPCLLSKSHPTISCYSWNSTEPCCMRICTSSRILKDHVFNGNFPSVYKCCQSQL